MDGNHYSIHFEGLRKVIRNPNITPSSKALLFDLLLYAGANGNCFPDEITLGNDLKLSDRQIRRLLIELNGSQVIRWKRGKPGQSNKYTLSPEIYFAKARTPTSAITGSTSPLQTGHIRPTKVISESNHLNGSQVLLQFEKASKKPISGSDSRRLSEMCGVYTEPWVTEAIQTIASRNLPYLKVGLVQRVLEDWARDGKPVAKPVFTPCGRDGCQGGFIRLPGSDTYQICACKMEYDMKVKSWNSNRSRIT